jgi:hypothetical protein
MNWRAIFGFGSFLWLAIGAVPFVSAIDPLGNDCVLGSASAQADGSSAPLCGKYS